MKVLDEVDGMRAMPGARSFEIRPATARPRLGATIRLSRFHVVLRGLIALRVGLLFYGFHLAGVVIAGWIDPAADPDGFGPLVVGLGLFVLFMASDFAVGRLLDEPSPRAARRLTVADGALVDRGPGGAALVDLANADVDVRARHVKIRLRGGGARIYLASEVKRPEEFAAFAGALGGRSGANPDGSPVRS